MRHLYLLFIAAFLVSSCGFSDGKKQDEQTNEIVQIVKTADEIQAEEKVRADSINIAEFEAMQNAAFGNLTFGMQKNQAEAANDKRQLLGKYNYNFQNLYNGDNELYAVILRSDGVKVINFDNVLKANYNNLYKIIETKYGKSDDSREFPSVFDVQDVGNFKVNQWDLGKKQIQIGIKENSLNSYSVAAKIYDKDLENTELKRLHDIKNKDVIEASKKF